MLVAGQRARCVAAACTDLTVAAEEHRQQRQHLQRAQLLQGVPRQDLRRPGRQRPAGSGRATPTSPAIDEGFSQYMRLLWEMNELPTDEAVDRAGTTSALQELNTQTVGGDQLVPRRRCTTASSIQVGAGQRVPAPDHRREAGVARRDRGAGGARSRSTGPRRASCARSATGTASTCSATSRCVTENDALGKTPPAQATRADSVQLRRERAERHSRRPAGRRAAAVRPRRPGSRWRCCSRSST